jgi:hypothetical protein
MKSIIKKLLREELGAHEIDSMLNQMKSNLDCDCCKYFDMGSLERYGGLEHPLYYLINKREINELEYIEPKQYIYKIARGFGVSYEDALSNAYDDNKATEYAEMMKSGSKSPIGFYTDGSSGQEGRHRAASAMKLGCKLIPVVKIINNISNEYVRDFVEKYKDYSREEIDKLYKDKGYNGISDLDWREFNNYVNYRL